MKIGIEGPKTLKMNMIMDLWKKKYRRQLLLLCEECQRRNPPPSKPRAPLRTITANYPFEKITWNIMGPLPASEKGYISGD